MSVVGGGIHKFYKNFMLKFELVGSVVGNVDIYFGSDTAEMAGVLYIKSRAFCELHAFL